MATNYIIRKKGNKEYALTNAPIEDVKFGGILIGWQVGNHYFPASHRASYTQARRCASGQKFTRTDL